MLYLVLSSEYAKERPVIDIAKQALEAGIDMLQMREKNIPEQELLTLGTSLLLLCKKHSTSFIVNDNPEIAKKLGADGVHLGQEDLARYPLSKTRDMLGKEKIIGVSTHSLSEFKDASKQDFSYIAFGPVFPTKTKQYHIGMDDIEEVLEVSRKPVFFIGGIDISNVDILIGKGVKNIAVIRAVAEADNVVLAVKKLQDRFLSPRRFASQNEAAGAQETVLIKINGKEQAILPPGNLSDLVNIKGLQDKAIVIEHNYRIVSKEKWNQTTIAEGDNIEIVSFVGGG